jgi:uncharacterized protein (DUF1697 family)
MYIQLLRNKNENILSWFNLVLMSKDERIELRKKLKRKLRKKYGDEFPLLLSSENWEVR